MKKIYSLIVLVSFLHITTTHAQTRIGVSAGLTHSTWKGEAVGGLTDLTDFANGMVTTQPKTGIYAGGFVEMPLGGIVSLQPGLYYSQKGYRLRGDIEGKGLNFLGAGARAEVQSHYIDIPLVFKVNVAKGLQVYAGPQVSYLVKNNLEVDAGLLGISLFKRNIDITDQFKKTDWALTGGLAYTFDNGFSINAGYDHGLSRLDRNDRFKSYNRNIKVGLGFTF